MRSFLFLSVMIISSLLGCKCSESGQVNYKAIIPINPDSTVNMIVEIPAGTTAKFEMNKDSYTLEIDSIDHFPRFIDYLGYPCNYGMIPNTILSKNSGGDGDPLDILLLGSAVESGSVQKVKIIGVLELLDNGEQDDKLIAINPESQWSKVKEMDDLDIFYPGARDILATFFQNYKGKGQIQLIDWSGKAKALKILESAIQFESRKN